MLYPQNGDRIVAVDSMTSLQLMYKLTHSNFQTLISATDEAKHSPTVADLYNGRKTAVVVVVIL